jgi:preprotein translocase subunit Sec61beta
MARKEKMQMPRSTAGLTMYFEDTKSVIKLKPEYIIGVCVALIVVEILLKIGVLII